MEEDPGSIAPGTVLADGYRLDGLIGRGAFGAVFRATVLANGSRAAVKVLAARALAKAGGVGRFRREAELVGRLSHPNSVRLLGIGEDPRGWLFIAFELLEGRSLEALLAERGALPERTAAAIASEVLAALEEAHSLLVIHRDLKPANIFLARPDPGGRSPPSALPTGERVKVLDFGLAKSNQPGTLAGLTQDGSTVGTPIYMSPEQIMGQPVTPKSDVFALGIVLAEMLHGGSLYDPRVAPLLLMTERLTGKAVPIPPAVAASPLRAVVERATALDPAKRFESATEMKQAIASLGLGPPVELQAASSRPFQEESTALPVLSPVLSNTTTVMPSPVLRAPVTGPRRAPVFETPGPMIAHRPIASETAVMMPVITRQRASSRARLAVIAVIAFVACAGIAAVGLSVLSAARSASATERAARRRDGARTASAAEATARQAAPVSGSANGASAPPRSSADLRPDPIDYQMNAARIPKLLHEKLGRTPVSHIVVRRTEMTVEVWSPGEGPTERVAVNDVFSPGIVESQPWSEIPLELDQIAFDAIPRLLKDAPTTLKPPRGVGEYVVIVNKGKRVEMIVFVTGPGNFSEAVSYDQSGRLIAELR